ncbi:glycerophosphodiester phosphodiesterase [Galbibacter pacificus]|uniref:Glycerophosphodiester phosphodiesterase family protein n=1 Tax=Galbibacter pacificus TaxID=2996052 RepID=A0ABT6FWD7_9FLAO|nr:glycerophosphodiester phosphodiesterase family protein [Galbibacter pacificus]MDG3584003.1 glycerophosphodiester phosphodiesterase family protein [Galbibacter pacificus]MDG3587560.1 glycerophosphodiester phosphodiesterase family protein [Galbibacter pacificus]
MIKKVSVFSVFLVLLQSCTEMKKEPIAIGHRGARGHVIENSLPSIKKGMDLGADAIEIDVFKIADGSIVVFHDDTVDRLTKASGPIEKYTKPELDTLSLEGNVKIPTLTEVLDLMDKKAMLNIELKGAGTAGPVYKIVQQYIQENGWILNDFIISSFKWDELEKMRGLDAQIPIGILTSKDIQGAIAEGEKLKAVAIHPNYKSLNAENVKEMHAKNFKIYPWTVNDSADIQQMKSFNVDGIITDYPERVR